MEASMGSWELLPESSEVVAVHAGLLPTGEVAFYSGNEGVPAEARVWNPETHEVYAPSNTPDTDLFCSGIALTFDGRLFVAGGTTSYSTGPGVPWVGSKSAYVFDPVDGWVRLEDMSFGRWYPTVICLPDGRMLVASGEGVDGARTQQIEIYDLQTGWEVLPGSANRHLPLYPRLHVLPDGRIACTGLGGTTAFLDLGQATWTELGAAADPGQPDPGLVAPGYVEDGYMFTGGDPSDKNNWVNLITGKTEAQEELENVGFAARSPDAGARGRLRHSSHQSGSATRADDLCVLLDPTTGYRILHAGGLVDGAATNSAEIIDFADANPAWRTLDAMHHPRWFPNSALLPNGKLLVVGGGRLYNEDPVMESEIFDPETETWSEDASMEVPRLYHSVALLLPDGRVWVAGTDGERRMEVYSPDYLEAGPRPNLTLAPDAVAYGQYFEIHVDEAADVASACFIRLGTATHAFNTEQRCIALEFAATGPDILELRAPIKLAIAPAGYYMLFVMNSAGVPAIAPIIRLVAV
jgi:hypothetical protein